MTDDAPTPADFENRVGELVGAFVRSAEIGVGSMITIDVEHSDRGDRVDHAWIYLADWVLLQGERECLAADMPDSVFAGARKAISGLVGQMILRVRHIAPDEVHIDFSGQLRLEVWANRDAYGPDQDVMRLFARGKHVATLTG